MTKNELIAQTETMLKGAVERLVAQPAPIVGHASDELTDEQIQALPRAYEGHTGQGARYHAVLLAEKPRGQRSHLQYRSLCGQRIGGDRVYQTRFSMVTGLSGCKRCADLLFNKIEANQASGL